MNARTLIGLLLAAGVAGLVFWLWPAPKRSPEDEIRALVARAAAAAEKRDLSGFSDCIAEDFHTPEVRSKADLKSTIAGYFFQNRDQLVVLNPSLQVEVLSRTEGTFQGTFVFARGPGTAVGDGTSRYEIDGEVQLRDEQWKVTAAKWRR